MAAREAPPASDVTGANDHAPCTVCGRHFTIISRPGGDAAPPAPVSTAPLCPCDQCEPLPEHLHAWGEPRSSSGERRTRRGGLRRHGRGRRGEDARLSLPPTSDKSTLMRPLS
ncbi:unnamed protein product [Pleuronectes platessa]|uniref:Uncharacterized protein n=1 Tax=Pleuronectes platessa TaxID=8262 RepID=A0A9N7U2F1_PLEPL|nr:unnamed protein product [Pleuronectes platessa]